MRGHRPLVCTAADFDRHLREFLFTVPVAAGIGSRQCHNAELARLQAHQAAANARASPAREDRMNISQPPAEARLAYSVREAAVATGISYVSLYAAIKRGDLRAHQVSTRKTLITRNELLRWIESH
jgi:excisionase family DNA binding protein